MPISVRFAPAPDFHRVVGDEPVPADDEVEPALALPDAALPDDEHAEPEHVHQHAMNHLPLGQLVVEKRIRSWRSMTGVVTGVCSSGT